VESDSIATLLGIVSASDLLTFDSWSTIRHSPLQAALRPLPGSTLTWRRKLGATYRDGGYLSAAARKVIDLLVEAGRGEGRGK
jgi:DNA-binding transcriptional LysR family regulator